MAIMAVCVSIRANKKSYRKLQKTTENKSRVQDNFYFYFCLLHTDILSRILFLFLFRINVYEKSNEQGQ